MDVERLVDGCKRGDRSAQAALYGAYSGRMLDALRRVVGYDDAAEDLLHDGFIIVFSSIGKLRDAGRLEPWMCRIMTNLALRYKQTQGRALSIEAAAGVADDADGGKPYGGLSLDDIMAMVDRLPDGYRKVFRLSVLDGLSHNEIAEILGIEPRSSSSQLLRARRKLIAMISERRARLGLLAVLLAAVLAVVMLRDGGVRRFVDVPKDKVDKGTAKRYGAEKGGAHTALRHNAKAVAAFAALEHVDTVLNAYRSCLQDPLPEMPRNILLTALSVPTDTLRMPLPVTAGGAVVADAGMTGGETHAAEKNNWLLGMNAVAGQASESLLPTVLSVIGQSVGSATRVDIETWQQLADYLTYDVGDGIDPLERDALLRIALQNEGRIYTRRTYDKPLQIGLNFGKRLTDRCNLDFGLRLTRHTTNLQTGASDTTNISERQRTLFVGVPFGATYSFVRKGRFSLYGTAGVALDIPFYGKAEREYNIENTVVYRRRDALHLPHWQWSVNAGVGVSYDLAPNLQLYFSPKLTWYVPNGSRTAVQWHDKPLQLSLPVGLRIVFK